jgi:nucleotide-binding universal stress UspA family protein
MSTHCIIVGLDDSAASRAAHRWAAEYARATGKDLCAVHVLDWPIGLNVSAIKTGTRLYVPKQEVAESYWRGMHRVFDDTDSPQGSTLRFAQGDVGDVLVHISTQAALLVVGTHEPARSRSYPLAGSIGHYCVSHASCPVVTVPELLPYSNGLPDRTTLHHASTVGAASGAAADVYRRHPSSASTTAPIPVSRQRVNVK